MATGDIKRNLYDKVLLNEESLKTRLLKYLEGNERAGVRAFAPIDQTFSGANGLKVSPGGVTDSLDISVGRGVDGKGNIFVVTALYDDIKFANVNTVVYRAGLKYVEVPNGTEINQATSGIVYSSLKDEIGEVADPTQVFDDGDNTLTIVVDSVYEAAKNHGGRTCRVWLTNPLTLESWFEDLTVVFGVHPTHFPATSKNYISTAGLLGQGSPSTTAAAYKVWAKGPSIREGSVIDHAADGAYLYLASIVGNGPSATVLAGGITDQRYVAMDDTAVAGKIQGIKIGGLPDNLVKGSHLDVSSPKDAVHRIAFDTVLNNTVIGTTAVVLLEATFDTTEVTGTAYAIVATVQVTGAATKEVLEFGIQDQDGIALSQGFPQQDTVPIGDKRMISINAYWTASLFGGSTPKKLRVTGKRVGGSNDVTANSGHLTVIALARA